MNLKKPISAAMAAIMSLSVTATPVLADDTQSASTSITANVPENYTITVPESVAMTGASGSGEKTATIPVTIKGDIAENQAVSVTTSAPVMKRSGSADVIATLAEPDSTTWSRSDCSGEGTSRNYIVSATLTPGDWNGVITFDCALSTIKIDDSLIPLGSTYTIKSSSEQLVGDGTSVHFPEIANNGDTYTDEDYKYTYSSFDKGWSVVVNDKSKSSYGALRTYICDKPITNMSKTFIVCKAMTTAPVIPDTVTNMSGTFNSCDSLTAPPVIPDCVTNMNNTFNGCTALAVAPVLPNSVTDITNIFSGCTSLKTYAGSVDSDGDFSNYNIPDCVNKMKSSFASCKLLTNAPTIPTNVTSVWSTFFGCTSLLEAPMIPSNVTDMEKTFYGCTSLSGTLICNANPTSYSNALKSTGITSIEGTCNEETKTALLATK